MTIPQDTLLSQVPFVAVDVETTGLDPEHDLIVEIGAVKVQANEVVETFETLVQVDRTIPFAASRVHGISNDMLVGKPRIADAMIMLLEFVQSSVLVEHSNQAFDVLFLEHAHGKPITSPYVNTCMLSRRLFPHLPRHSLDECCRRFNIVNDVRDQHGRHRALADAHATAQLLHRLLDLSATRYPRLGDLVGACSIERVKGGRKPKPYRHHHPTR